MAWINHKSRFPILFKIARRKYWNIPATSVPIEWLFNDAGNQITNDWNHLKIRICQWVIVYKEISIKKIAVINNKLIIDQSMINQLYLNVLIFTYLNYKILF